MWSGILWILNTLRFWSLLWKVEIINFLIIISNLKARVFYIFTAARFAKLGQHWAKLKNNLDTKGFQFCELHIIKSGVCFKISFTWSHFLQTLNLHNPAFQRQYVNERCHFLVGTSYIMYYYVPIFRTTVRSPQSSFPIHVWTVF